MGTSKSTKTKASSATGVDAADQHNGMHTPGFDGGESLGEADTKALQEVAELEDEEPPQHVDPAAAAADQEESSESNNINDKATAAAAPSGNILEAAFVDPAYQWPPADGQGKNAIELQASLQLLEDDDAASEVTTPSMKQRMKNPAKSVMTVKKAKWWQCCQSDQHVVTPTPDYAAKKQAAKEARKAHAHLKADRRKHKERTMRKQQKYARVPEGVLIYRLDTSTRELTLMSPAHSNTDLDTLVTNMMVYGIAPSPDKSRRGLILTDEHGDTVTLVACEQRTATAWLEAVNLMLAKDERLRSGLFGGGPKKGTKSEWSKEKLKDNELTTIEDQYMNLANYSNKLIRAGALPGGKRGAGGAGGIYYSIEKVHNDPWAEDPEEEALEAIAKRRAVIKDSWDFFRMICSLLRDRNKYDEVFRRMKLDPVYPYLNSMTGLNDVGDLEKPVLQRDRAEYAEMSKLDVAKALVSKGEAAMPSLVEICKALAGSLGMEEVGVGPIKDPASAIRKAEKKYDGDLLKVTDYCRALLVVKDFPSLLALLELARDSFGPLIRRVKMSSLKSEHKSKAGGYRDCIINVELKEHICEIQIHLWPLWTVCGVDGFRHYRHCVEYNTDSFDDAFDALEGLDRKTMAELIVMAEEAVAETPLDNLEWYHEKFILDYFAEAGLFMKHGLDVWAEIIFRNLIKLRTESPDIGPDHHETITLYRYLAQSLRAQGKYDAATDVMTRVKAYEQSKSTEKKEAEKSLWDSFFTAPSDAYDMIMDPNRKEREKDERVRKEVKASKKQWRRIRQERFPFLDSDLKSSGNSTTSRKTRGSMEEKKTDYASAQGL